MNSIVNKMIVLLSVLLFFACTGKVEKIAIKDNRGIKESLSKILKEEYGLYAIKGSQVSSTADFRSFTLVLMGEAEPDIDLNVASLGMGTSNKFLFNSIETIQISDNLSTPAADKPGMTMNENVTSPDGSSMNRIKNYYGKDAKYNNIIKDYISNQKGNSIYLMKKEYLKNVANKLNEIVLWSDGTNKDSLIVVQDTQNTVDTLNLPPPPPGEEVKVEEVKSEEVLQFAEQMPEFPGGSEKLIKFIADNLVYPKEAKEQGIQGKVILQFVVLSNGKIGDIKVLRGISEQLDAEAVRVIKKLPVFTPGKQDGKTVNVSLTIPVLFKIE